MYATSRHGGPKKRPGYRVKPSMKRWKFSSLFDAVKKIVLEAISEAERCEYRWGITLYREEIAKKLRADPSEVEVCLKKLNLDGLVGQPDNIACRDRSVWVASRYVLVSKFAASPPPPQPQTVPMPNNWPKDSNSRRKWEYKIRRETLRTIMRRRGKHSDKARA